MEGLSALPNISTDDFLANISGPNSTNISAIGENSTDYNDYLPWWSYYYYSQVDYADLISSVFGYLPESYQRARLFLFDYIMPAIWIVSLLGNSLIIIIFSLKKNRGTSTSIYLTSLAVSDLWLNTSSTLMSYLIYLRKIPPPSSTTECYYRNWVPFSVIFVGPWILVTISLERMVSVFIPHKVKVFCTANSARVTIICLWIVFFGLGLLHERVYVLDSFHGSRYCTVRPDLEEFYFTYIGWIISILKFILPSIIIFVCTVIIIFVLLRRKMTKNRSKSRDISLTLILINVNIIFLITNGTYMIYHLLYLFEFEIVDYEGMAYGLFWEAYLLALNDVNSAVNIFVYCLTGSKFRNDVVELFWQLVPRCTKAKQETVSGTMSTGLSSSVGVKNGQA